MLHYLACALLSLGLVFCSKKPAPPVAAAPVALPVAQAEVEPAQPVEDSRLKIQELLTRVFKPVYFPFDQASLSEEARQLLAEAGMLMKQEPSISVIIQGNTDDRGTEEYNLALGQRRAQTVKNYLLGFGIDSSRLKVVSYGEEKPALEGSEESARAMNRRDEFLVSF